MESTTVKQQNPGVEEKNTPKTPTFEAPKKKNKWLKRLLIAGIILALIGYFFIWPMIGAGQQILSTSYLMGTAEVKDITVAVSSTGTVTPIESYKVSALVTGEVLEAPFEEGDWVEKGALLYRIDAGDAESALEQAQLSVRQAQLSYNNLADNLSPSASGPGVVQQVYVQKGDLVSTGTPIADIADTSVMTITLPFQSTDAQELYVGQSATVTIAGSLETLPATVESVSSADLVGAGGSLVRQVKLSVNNPGALTEANSATATVGLVACAQSGNFQANMRQTVVAQATGEVTQLHVTAGSKVSNGTSLVTLGGSVVTTSLENASIGLQNAQITLQRTTDALDNYVITAPISGTVIEKNFKVGDNIESSSITAAAGNLAVLFDMSTLTFEMNINELDINKIEVGQKVSITASAVEEQVYTGIVDAININGTTISSMTTYPITVTIQNPDLLKPGMNVSADIIVEHADNVLAVPVDAVHRGSELPYVLVAPAAALDENGNVKDPALFEQREVTLGRNDAGSIEITSGLSEGDIVVWKNQIADWRVAMMGG